MKTIGMWQEAVHQCAKEHGWWEDFRKFPELAALLHSEISEALEAYRKTKRIFFEKSLPMWLFVFSTPVNF